MSEKNRFRLNHTRRHFLTKAGLGIGSIALGSLMIPGLFNRKEEEGLLPALGIPQFAPKAKRIIYLFQNGAPSQLETFDYKPLLNKMQGQDLPASIRMGQRLTGMTASQEKFPLVGSAFAFRQHGRSGAWISDMFPHMAGIADDICIIKTIHTDAINHDPALTFFQTGAQQGNRPSMGAWMSYGLGSDNKNLPAYCVLLSRGRGNGQGVYSKLWTNGFLDSIHQGVVFSSGEDPVLYLNNPQGQDRNSRREMLDQLAKLNALSFEKFGDPEIEAKIQQYEMSYRMQTAVPELTDLSKEPDHIIKMYGPDCLVPGTYAANCLLARKLSESGLGPARQSRWRDAAAGTGCGPCLGSAGERPQTERPARRDARHLGRRIRQDQLLPGKSCEGQLRPRPSSEMLQHLDGGRRHQGRYRLRRDR
jgi:hypothetical protein